MHPIIVTISISLSFLARGVFPQDQYYHLPKNVRPFRYNLTIEHHKNTSFSGSVSIDIKVLAVTKNITFHSKDLTLGPIRLYDTIGREIYIVNHIFDEDRDLCILFLRGHLVKHERYKLVIEKFVGNLQHEKSGFFLAKYNDEYGKERNLSLTHFEPNGARTAFPCFDEPGLRAKFIVSIIRDENYNSASNEKLAKSIYLGHGRYQDTFRETVEMPTYLVAFVISDFVYTKEIDRVRVLARREAIANGGGEYVLDEAVRLLRAMEDFTGLRYSLSKVDLLAVPSSYFLDGAMENWGLIMYGDDHLLYYKSTSTTEDLQRCTTYTAHELAHQWFGNLVTPKSWHYIWLSEGFAAYFQYHATDMVEPSWRLREQFVIEEVHKAFTGDLIPMAHPLNYVFEDANSFPSPWMYYYKASAIIKMTEHFLTPPLFREGLRIYLQRKKFSTSQPSDLYRAWQTAVDHANAGYLLDGMPMKKIWGTWDTNVGYPVVTATRDYRTGSLTLTQETYNADNSTGDSSVWIIPITYVLHGAKGSSFAKTMTDFWMTEKTMTLKDFRSDSWLILNKQHAGYFRVNYDTINWYRIIEFLRTYAFKSIHPLNRAQLVNDAFQLVEDAKLNAKIALDLSEFIKQETDYIVLKPFLKRIDSFDFMVAVTPEYPIFQQYVIQLLNFAYEHIGPEEVIRDTHIRKLTRVIVVRRLCLYGDERCQQFGLNKIKTWQRTGRLDIPTDLKFHFLCGAMQNANQHEWDFLFQQYYKADPNDQIIYIMALACTRNRLMLHSFLGQIYDYTNAITTAHRTKALVNMIENNVVGREVVLTYATTQTLPQNSSLEEANSADTITQIVPSRLTDQVELYQNSENAKLVPANFFTKEYLEQYEIDYIDQISDWLRDRQNTLEM
ncbi:hypothetical protein PPYR_11060 [Photinus pyralis]|uniref:Aminopeptidase n=1 Tax=Photinus pyralis TaxID=7054 RepID=A0A1Y1M378_PHOPY|nr:aminopeptidase N-like [Photinus pyralis]KAB0796999.1 hypothetical protein PPYR_11060 [Photinus pyralis]